MAERAQPAKAKIAGGVREALAHDSARKHVTGEAIYTDDIPSLSAHCTWLRAEPPAPMRGC